MTKKSGQKLKYIDNEKSLEDEIKRIFIIFKGLSIKQITHNFFGRWEPDFNKLIRGVNISLKYLCEVYGFDFICSDRVGKDLL